MDTETKNMLILRIFFSLLSIALGLFLIYDPAFTGIKSGSLFTFARIYTISYISLCGWLFVLDGAAIFPFRGLVQYFRAGNFGMNKIAEKEGPAEKKVVFKA